MTKEEIIEGLKLLEDNMVYFDELLNDKGKWIDVHELLFEAIEVLEQDTVPFDYELYQAGLMDMPKGMIEVLDKIRDEINSPNRGTCDYFIVDRIEEIINKYTAEKEK